MKKTVCAVMAVVMLVLCVALYSCKNGTEPAGSASGAETEPAVGTGENTEIDAAPESVTGTWTAEVSAVGFLFPGDEWDTGSRTWEDSTIKLSLSLSESGTVILGLNKSETRDFVSKNLESVVAMFDYTLEEVKEEGKYETDDDVVDALIDTFTSLNKTGNYTYEDGILKTELVSLAHTHGKEDAEEIPAEIKVTGNAEKLTFTEYAVESDEHGLFNKNVLPVTFERYN